MATHPEEHLLIHIPDHADRAAQLVLWQDKGKQRIEALVRAMGKAAQLFEETCWAVIVGASTIQGSEGKNLDRWGAIVGEFRGGLPTEELYRRFIELRIRVNNEFQNTDNMWSVLAAAVEPSTVTSYLVADGLVYQIASEEWLDASVATHAAALIRDFRPAGMYAPIVEYVPDHFALDWEDDAPTLTDGTGTAVLAELHYSGRSR